MGKKAIIAGASGLIGSHLLTMLLHSPEYSEVVALVRRELPLKHDKLKQLIINFDELDKYAGEINGDAVFSCMGTTKAQTPDRNQYYKIEHDYPLHLAQLAKQNGVKQFLLVSAVGADAKSSNFYLKFKGETEDDIIALGLPGLHIYRPSMLVGRKEKVRVTEQIINGLMQVFNPLLLGAWKKYHSIAGKDVAKAMFNKSIDNENVTHIYEYDEIINGVPDLLEIVDINLTNDKNWLFKFSNRSGEVVFIKDGSFYEKHGLKFPITKQHLDAYNIGMKIKAKTERVANDIVVINITKFIVRDNK